MKKLIIFTIMVSFFGAQIFTIDVKYFQLSLFRIAVLLTPIIILIMSLKNGENIKLINRNKNNIFSIKFMMLWILYAIISVLWMRDFNAWVKNIYFLGSGVLCALCFNIYLNNKKDIINVFNAMQIMIILNIFIGIYEIITKNYRFINNYNLNYYSSISDRIPISMMGNPNDYGTLMLFGVVVGYICFKTNKYKIMKSLSFITMITSAIMILTTKSRANLIGLILIICLYVCLTLKNKKFTKIIIFSLTVFTVLIYNWNAITQYLNQSLYLNFDTVGSDVIRLNLIKNGLNFLFWTAGFGTGAGQIEYYMSNFPLFNIEGITNMHNWWLEILVSYGIIIFIFYVFFYLKLFKTMIYNYKFSDDKDIKSISLGIAAFLISFVVAGVSSSSNINCEWLWCFWGIAISFQGIDNNNISKASNYSKYIK